MRVGSMLICQFVRKSSSRNRPWQISAAIVLGLLLGILPKLSLLCAFVALLCFIAPIHLPLAVLAAVAAAFATPLLEAPVGRLGIWSLTHPQLSALWLNLDNLPLAPWLGIHNTVVHGNLMLWLAAAIPVYLLVLVVSKALLPSEIESQIADILHTSSGAGPNDNEGQTYEVRPVAGSREPSNSQTSMVPPEVIWDDIDYSLFDDPDEYSERSHLMYEEIRELGEVAALPTESILNRAADIAAWAEELITEELLMDKRKHTQEKSILPELANPQALVNSTRLGNEGTAAEDRWLIETTMEVVRIAERAVTNQAAMKKHGSEPDVLNQICDKVQSLESHAAYPAPDLTATSEQNVHNVDTVRPTASEHREVEFTEATIRRGQSSHYDHRSHLDTLRTGVVNGAFTAVVNHPREEALHYLLRHLKGIQEKAQQP